MLDQTSSPINQSCSRERRRSTSHYILHMIQRSARTDVIICAVQMVVIILLRQNDLANTFLASLFFMTSFLQNEFLDIQITTSRQDLQRKNASRKSYQPKFTKIKVLDFKLIRKSWNLLNQASSPIAQDYSRERRRSTNHCSLHMVHRPALADKIICGQWLFKWVCSQCCVKTSLQTHSFPHYCSWPTFFSVNLSTYKSQYLDKIVEEKMLCWRATNQKFANVKISDLNLIKRS